MSVEVLKVESELEECCVCGARDAELASPEEADAGAGAGAPQTPLRAMLLHLNNAKVIPNGRLCTTCIQRTQDAYSFSSKLAAKGPPPLSEKIRALRNRLHELTQKIDVFIVVGGGGGADGAYSEDDIIMVERGALAACTRADRAQSARAPDARGDPVYQCSACPLTFHRMSTFRAHTGTHAADCTHWCWACGASFARAADVVAHALTHAPAAPLHCHLCDTSFQSSGSLRRHEAGCPSTCPVPACGAALGSRTALRSHALASHPALCPQCFLLCDSSEERAAHALHHTRDKHFVCGYKACILRFHTRSNLLAHIRKCHGGDPASALAPAPTPAPEQPVPVPTVACKHCPRTFGSQAAMKRHARTHTNHKDDADGNQDMEWTGAETEGRVEYLEVETLEELEEAQ